MKIFQFAEGSAGQVDLQLRHDGVEVIAVDGQRLSRAASEIAQDQIVRGLVFGDHDGFTFGFDAEFNHALIIRFPERSLRYPHPGETSVVEP